MIHRDAVDLDIDDGNRPFGGYGDTASSVRHDGRSWAELLHLSDQVAKLSNGDR